MKKFITAAVIATLAISSPASAAVSFDHATGTGAVGKGDIQLAFGWNNAALQRNAAGLSFSVTEVDTYEFDCEWFTNGNKNKAPVRKEMTKKSRLNSSIAYGFDARTKNQIVGFNITGVGLEIADGNPPAAGDQCHGEGNAQGTIEDGSVQLVETRRSELQVTHGGITHDLPNTPVVVAVL
jgi:hypothetical protein